MRNLDLHWEAIAQQRHGLLEQLKIVMHRFTVAMVLNENDTILQRVLVLRQDIGNIKHRFELLRNKDDKDM